MLKNKVDKLILKAFLETPVPAMLRREDLGLAQRAGDDLRSVTNRLLMGRSETIEILTPTLLTKEDKAALNNLITRCQNEEDKRELVFFYRLAILVETIVLKYRLIH